MTLVTAIRYSVADAGRGGKGVTGADAIADIAKVVPEDETAENGAE